jgi:rare lipoprotein A
MMRLAPIAFVLVLAACGSAPKKSAPPPPEASPVAGSAATTPVPRKVSPYAPAQEDLSKRGDYVAGGLYAPGVKDSIPDHLPDVDAIPEPDIVEEPRSRYGNRSPYQVLGRSYHVLDRSDGYVEQGLASYYGNKFHGRRTSNQEVYDMYAFTAAHKSLPLPSFARVTNLDNGRTVVVRVNDRGPFHEGRVIDLSYAAAVKLGIHPRGTGRVEVRGLSPGEDARPGASVAAARAGIDPATGLPHGVRVATGKPQRMPASPIDAVVESLPQTGTHTADVAAARVPAAGGTGDGDWRFDMRQDGRTMTADEFDAWMKRRGARVATGKPGQSEPVANAMPAAASAALAGATMTPPAAAGMVLQVAAFSTRDNAERALDVLRRAGIAAANVLDGSAEGKPIWRLRVGPVASTGVADLSARVAGLGFGTPHVVRD